MTWQIKCWHKRKEKLMLKAKMKGGRGWEGSKGDLCAGGKSSPRGVLVVRQSGGVQ